MNSKLIRRVLYFLVVIVIGIVVMFFFPSNCRGDKKGKGLNKSLDSLKSQTELYLASKVDSLQKQLNSCSHAFDLARSDYFDEKNRADSLQSALDDCQAGKKPVAHKPVRKEVKKPVAGVKPVKTTKPGGLSPDFLSAGGQKVGGQNNNIPTGKQYVSNFSGDFGCTPSPEGKVVYFIKKTKVAEFAGQVKEVIAPKFSWEGGEDMVSQGEYWVHYSNYKAIAGNSYPWCVYVGKNKSWGYPMFLPHEYIRANSAEAKQYLNNGFFRANSLNGYEFVPTIRSLTTN